MGAGKTKIIFIHFVRQSTKSHFTSPLQGGIDLLFLSSKKKIGKKMPGLLKN
jgi:hypothetical protein